MRKMLCLAGLVLVFMGGSAMAEGRGGHRSGGSQHGGRSSGTQHNRGYGSTQHGASRNVYQNNGRYHFDNGSSVSWRAPVSTTRHRDYRVRPRAHYESYQSVSGYAWVPGSWQWDGYEWIWQPGYYARSGYGYGY